VKIRKIMPIKNIMLVAILISSMFPLVYVIKQLSSLSVVETVIISHKSRVVSLSIPNKYSLNNSFQKSHRTRSSLASAQINLQKILMPEWFVSSTPDSLFKSNAHYTF
ncbi:MAG: hypothetical protein KAI17_20355, partial [Thiotrichaceae bacterium]|nr:hypothetical protein [Thiotrichaceae bacterium]